MQCKTPNNPADDLAVKRHFKISSLPLAYRLTILLGQLVRLLCRVELKGFETIPLNEPLLIAANHISYFDPLLLSAYAPRLIHWIAKPELFRRPFLRRHLVRNFVFPAARGDKSDLFLKGVSQKILKGQAVGIFPQGGIEKPGEAKEPKRGAVTLALKTGCSVVFVHISGTRQLYSPKAFVPKWIKIRLIASPPFQLKAEQREYSEEELDRLSREWMERIKAL